MSLAWGGHRNGYIPASALTDIGGGKLLQADAARNWLAFVAACKAATGTTIYLNAAQDAYRSYARQVYYKLRQPFTGVPAATPGTSNHGWARAVDCSGYGSTGSTAHRWMQANAARFGFSWNVGRAVNEPWHWEYLGAIGYVQNQGVRDGQTLLNRFGYNLKIDGVNGPATIAAVKDFQSKNGLVVDGILGPRTKTVMLAKLAPAPAPAVVVAKPIPYNRGVADGQNLLNRFGYKLAVDGVNGPATIAAVKHFQAKHRLTADGVLGPKTKAVMDRLLVPPPAPAASGNALIRAVQAKLKSTYPSYGGRLTVDGINGPATKAAVKEFQRRSGLTADGIVGPKTRARLGV